MRILKSERTTTHEVIKEIGKDKRKEMEDYYTFPFDIVVQKKNYGFLKYESVL